jgi:hypothetical protein
MYHPEDKHWRHVLRPLGIRAAINGVRDQLLPTLECPSRTATDGHPSGVGISAIGTRAYWFHPTQAEDSSELKVWREHRSVDHTRRGTGRDALTFARLDTRVRGIRLTLNGQHQARPDVAIAVIECRRHDFGD